MISIAVRDTGTGSVSIWSSGYSRVDDIPAPINRVQHAVAAVRETVEFWANSDYQLYRAAMREQVEPIFLDPGQPDQARMQALSTLAPPRFGVGDRLEYPDQGATLGGAVADAAVKIATASEDASVRRDVWEIMAGVRDPGLAKPLLVALQTDTDAGVRTAAAKALAEHAAVPAVRDALHGVRSSDPDAGVREAARAALASPRLAFGEQRSRFMNTGQPSGERWKSLTALMLIHESNPVPVDGALLETIAGFATANPDPWKRVSAWQRYTSLAGSDAIAPLTKALEFDDSAVVRERLVMELSQFADNASVADSIDRACVTDASQEVRYAAYRALDGICSSSAAAYTWNWPDAAVQPE